MRPSRAMGALMKALALLKQLPTHPPPQHIIKRGGGCSMASLLSRSSASNKLIQAPRTCRCSGSSLTPHPPTVLTLMRSSNQPPPPLPFW